jgi:UDP-glucose 4-epimerase
MKFFITGGAGFIVSNLVGRVLSDAECDKVVIYDNLKSGSLELIDGYLNDPRVTFVHGDIHECERLKDAMQGCDTLIHLAANPDISKAESEPALDFYEGTLLTQHVLEAARINSVNNILFTSGSGVYGEVTGEIFSESYGPSFPVSPYGAAKLGSEALISAYCHMFNIRGRALRFANVVGPNQTHGVGFDFINRLFIDKTKLKILGDGSQCKSYIYISDILDAIQVVLREIDSGLNFDVYNVATRDYITVTDIATLACSVVGVESSNIEFHYTGGDRGWNGDVPKILFNTDKIRSLGWSNKFTSAEAIKLSLRGMFARKMLISNLA